MLYGVDISEHNGFVDFEELKQAGIKFVIIRCSYGLNEDSNFKDNVYRANKAGLMCGVYHYSYALTVERAIEESEFVCNLISECGCFLGLPIFLDMEDADNYKRNRGITNVRINEICKYFINHTKKYYDCGLYASFDWLKNIIDWKTLDCCIWSAQWCNVDNFKGYMWQYTDNLNINGKLFDGNILYEYGVDF